MPDRNKSEPLVNDHHGPREIPTGPVGWRVISLLLTDDVRDANGDVARRQPHRQAAAAKSRARTNLASRPEIQLVLFGWRKLEVHASRFAQRRYGVVEGATQFLRPVFQRPVFGARVH